MATYNKYNIFAGSNLPGGVHDLLGTAGSGANTCKVMLSNTGADAAATNETRSQITEIANGNGYTTGGESVANVGAHATGTFTLTGTNVTWTSSGAGMAAFRYVILYDDTPASPADPLIAWWDYASALTLAAGETFTIKFNGGASSGTIATLA